MVSNFTYPFLFFEDETNQVKGHVDLDEPLPFTTSGGSGFYRPGKVTVEGCPSLELVLYHNPATAAFIYTRNSRIDTKLLETVGLPRGEIAGIKHLHLPGQLCMGSDRAKIIGQAVKDIFTAPSLSPIFSTYGQQNMAIFPIAREGLKYQVADAIFDNYGYYCDEVILDAHHVFDSSVPVYNRKVEMTIFKDKDLDKQQHENIAIAFLADSIASGMVMREVIERVNERFDHLLQVEVIAPLASVRGLTRLASMEYSQNIKVRVHVFETLLNALPPDYYYSAHYDLPGFHIRPDLEAEYHQWWGKDAAGNCIADTACAGYGWSEVFYSPRKQIQMMNQQLESRHGLNILDIIRRNIET